MIRERNADWIAQELQQQNYGVPIHESNFFLGWSAGDFYMGGVVRTFVCSLYFDAPTLALDTEWNRLAVIFWSDGVFRHLRVSDNDVTLAGVRADFRD